MASIDGVLPSTVRLHRLGVAFTLPGPLPIQAAWDRALRTTGPCLVRLGLGRTGLEVAASPPLLIDAIWPAKNMALSGLTVHFASGQVDVHVGDRHGGLIDFQKTARTEFTALAQAALKGTRAGVPGYDPFADQDLVETLVALGRNFEATPTHGKTAAGPQHLQAVAADAEVELVEPFAQSGLRVAPGGRVAVAVSGAGSLATVLAAQGIGAALQAAAVQHVALSSDAVTLEAGGRAVARLEALRVLRGGQVQIDRLSLEGAADLAAGVEALVGLLYRAAGFSQGGLGPDAAMRVAAHPDLRGHGLIEPTARALVGRLLEEALRDLLRQDALVGGVSLRSALGFDPQA